MSTQVPRPAYAVVSGLGADAEAVGSPRTAARTRGTNSRQPTAEIFAVSGYPQLVKVSGLAAVAAAAALVSGCGDGHAGGGAQRNAAGEKVFASAGCGSCHTLGAAQANGQIGPNLDQLKPGYAAVVRQVSSGGNGMPAFGGRLSKTEIGALARYVVDSTKNSTATVVAFKPDRKTVAGCHGDYACLKQAFGNLAYYDGPQSALSALARAMRTDSTVNGGCHQIAHEIGHAAYVRYHDNAAQALAHGAMTCWSGYYHGVIERAFGGLVKAQVTAAARRLCAGRELRTSTFLLYQCVHGLGHGLMIYSQNDLPYSLRVCDRLRTAWDRSSCTGGVFMQNFLPGPMQIAPTRWVSKKDLLYPCDAVAARDKLYCYLMVTSRILPAVDYRWRTAAAWCRRAERAWVVTCFQSYGRDASGFSNQNPPQIVKLCANAGAGAGERECIYGAARDLTANDAGPARASRMCLLAPAATRSYCFEGIGTIVGGFANEAADRRARCNAGVPERWRAACYRGANA
jgi:mono/diheme cytochrome c family protein